MSNLSIYDLIKIFNYLPNKDKLNLRLLNKEFKSICDNKQIIKIDCLTLIPQNSNDTFSANWFYTNRLNDDHDLIEFNEQINLTILNNLFSKTVFLNVRKLFFKFTKSIGLNRTINKLINLEELNILSKINSNQILSLTKLRILSINENVKKLKLETPSLAYLKCFDLDNFQFNYPEKLIYLYLDLSKSSRVSINQIRQFINLEYLFSNNYSNFDLLLLTELNKLKQLIIYKFFDFDHYSSFDEFNHIYQFKKELNLKNLKIYLSGVDYECLNSLTFDVIGCTDKLIFNNYLNTINVIPFVNRIDFNILYEYFHYHHVLLDDLAFKLPNIKYLKATLYDNNIYCFFKFLTNYNNLIELKLKLLIDNQDNYNCYYSRLADSCKRLEHLEFNSTKLTDLQFLLEFKYLKKLILNKLGDHNIVDQLFKQLKHLDEIQFYFKNYPISYEGKYYFIFDRKFENYNDLACFCSNC